MWILEQSHSEEKSERGPFEFFNIHFVAKHQKKSKGDPLETLKNSKNYSSEKKSKRWTL